MPQRKGLLSPQNTFLDTIATRFDGTHSNFVLGNAQAKDYPIVYCSDGFCELTGYPRSQIMSTSCACKFIWGEETLPSEIEKITNALERKTELKTEVIFYTKKGSPFVCLFDIVPIKNEKGQVVLFLASHKDITKERDYNTDFSEDERNYLGSSDKDNDHERPLSKLSDMEEGRRISEDEDEKATSYKYNRRRSRAVLYHLQGTYQHKSKGKLNRLNQFAGQNVPDYKPDGVQQKPCCILLHYGLIRIAWDWIIMIGTFYVAIIVPFNAIPYQHEGTNKDQVVLDIMVEFIFIIDVALNFRTTYVSPSGQVVYHPRSIALNYLKGWLFVDLLAAIPFDFLMSLYRAADSDSNSTMLEHDHGEASWMGSLSPKIHLMKLAKLLRFLRLLQKIDRYAQYSSVVLLLLMSSFSFFAHWIACVWYAIGISDQNSTYSKAGWLSEFWERLYTRNNGTTGKASHFQNYLTALYFACSSMTSVGFGNVSANTENEKIFAICIMLLGALMHAAVFGNVTAIIQRMYSRRAAYQDKTKDLKDFTRAHHIPKPLRRRMEEFFQTMWAMNHGIHPSEILKDFPEELRGDIAIHLNRDFLSLPIFSDASKGCLKTVAQQIKTTFCTPGEYLIHSGDVLKNLYFVGNGSLEILNDDVVVALLGKGDLFGCDLDGLLPPPALNKVRSSSSVKALTYCDMQYIDIHDLLTILDQYADFAQHFTQQLHNELSFNIRACNVPTEITSSSSATSLSTTSSGSVVLPSVTANLPVIAEDDESHSVRIDSPSNYPALPSNHLTQEPYDHCSVALKRADQSMMDYEDDNYQLPRPNSETISTSEQLSPQFNVNPQSHGRPLYGNDFTKPSRLNHQTVSPPRTRKVSWPANKPEVQENKLYRSDLRRNSRDRNPSYLSRSVEFDRHVTICEDREFSTKRKLPSSPPPSHRFVSNRRNNNARCCGECQQERLQQIQSALENLSSQVIELKVALVHLVQRHDYPADLTNFCSTNCEPFSSFHLSDSDTGGDHDVDTNQNITSDKHNSNIDSSELSHQKRNTPMSATSFMEDTNSVEPDIMKKSRCPNHIQILPRSKDILTDEQECYATMQYTPSMDSDFSPNEYSLAGAKHSSCSLPTPSEAPLIGDNVSFNSLNSNETNESDFAQNAITNRESNQDHRYSISLSDSTVLLQLSKTAGSAPLANVQDL